MFSSATQPPPRHKFVVSAITFEKFKLHSSNLTHALLIQISRTNSIINIVVPSGGHFVQKNFKKSCISISNGKKCDQKLFSDIKNGRRRPFCQKLKKIVEIRMDLKWPKNAIESEFRTSNMADQSEMARNAIKSDFRTSKMFAAAIL